MERTWLPEAETRLTLLYCLRALGPVTGGQLERYLLTNGLVNYFDLRLNLSALVELGQVRSGEHPAGVLLVPTPEGLQALEAFTGRIPASRRETIDQTAAAWRDICRRELERPALEEKQADGTTRLRLLLVEDGRTLAELSLPWEGACPRARWQAAAPAVWRTLLQRLTGEEPGEDPAPESPETGEDRVVLRRGDFTADLALGPLAERAKRRWPAEAEALERTIRETLKAEA